MRVTVKVRMPHDTSERDFHLHESAAAKLVARVVSDGGQASIGPLTLSPVLKSLLQACNVDEASIH